MEKWRSGLVIRGDQYGRTLGFPTANLDTTLAEDVTKDGIYAASIRLDNQIYKGALYLAPRLTLGETARVLEIHVLDFTGDLYGKPIAFQLGAFIRAPKDFRSVDELKAQLAQDIAAVRRALV